MTTTIAIISNNMIIINHARVPKILWAQATAIPFQPGMTAFFTRTMMGPQPGAGMGEEKSLGGMVGLWVDLWPTIFVDIWRFRAMWVPQKLVDGESHL